MPLSSVNQALNRLLLKPWVKPVLWTLYALPLAWLLYGAVTGQLGANPAEKMIRGTGDWTLRWLWLTLAISPLRELASMPALLRHRRALGVTAFIYGVLHFLSYSWLDKGFVWPDIVRDIGKRNFILVGVLALILMMPLALTSFNAAIRALGGKRWQMLHRLVYLVALLGLLHFYWKKSIKNDTSEVMVYAVILTALLGWRMVRRGGVKGLLGLR